MVVYWQILHKDQRNEDGSVEKKHIPLLKQYYVFNLDQTTLQNVSEGELLRIATAEQIIENFEDKPEITQGTKPCYIPKLDRVEMPNLQDFQTSEDYHSVLFHELSHSTGSANRLNRKGITERNKF